MNLYHKKQCKTQVVRKNAIGRYIVLAPSVFCTKHQAKYQQVSIISKQNQAERKMAENHNMLYQHRDQDELSPLSHCGPVKP